MYSEHVLVTPGPGSGLMTGTRDSVPPTKPGKPGATTTLGSPVTPGDSVRKLVRKLKRKRPTSAQSELPVLNSQDRSVQLEHNVHKQPGNMPILQAEHWSEHSKAINDVTNSDSPNIKAYESPERTQL